MGLGFFSNVSVQTLAFCFNSKEELNFFCTKQKKVTTVLI